jgi:AcrR family transcriptional regulator
MGKNRTLHTVTDAAGPQRRDLAARERIIGATLRLLGECGYARLTIERVATCAAVGKATLYRSWSNKAALVLDAVRSQLSEVPTEETGDSRTELLAVADEALAGFFGSAKIRSVLPALVADTAQDEDLRRRFREEVIEPRKARSRTVVERVVARGDLPADTDVDMLLESWAGAMLFRGLFLDQEYDADAVARLVDATLGSPPRLPAAGAGT